MPINKNVADMVDALGTKNATSFQNAFDAEMRERVNVRLDAMKVEVAHNMVNNPVEQAPVESAPAEQPAAQ